MINANQIIPRQYAQNIITTRNANMVKLEGHVSAEAPIADLKQQLAEKEELIAYLRARSLQQVKLTRSSPECHISKDHQIADLK